MRIAHIRRHGVMVLALAVLPWAWASAGDFDAEEPDGEPTPNATFISGWNPTFECVVEEGDTMDDVLDCLADGIASPPGAPCDDPYVPDRPDTINDPDGPSDIMQNPPGGNDDGCDYDPQDREDFRVTRLQWPRYGLHIEFLDGSEIDRLLLWENDPAIQMTSLEVQKDGLLGRIGHFREKPSRQGGIVTVTVNGHAVSINTALHRKADDLTDELKQGLKAAGFEVQDIARYLIVGIGGRPEGRISSIRFESTDSRIATSDLALLPLVEILLTLQDNGL